MKWTIAAALRQAANIMQQHDTENSRRNANLLLGFVLDKNLTFLIAHDDDDLSAEQQKLFFELVDRRTSGEPLQYILGRQEFYGLEFAVNESVLIPRPETELLVEIALEILGADKSPSFCDVGVGSGCVSIAILKNLPSAQATALDISPLAIETAKRNAAKHKVSERIEFYESDLFAVFQNLKSKIQNPKFDIIVSNPPYIPESDLPDLQREVREFEPHSALFSGADGLEIIKEILVGAPDYLTKNGFLSFEIGFGQSAQIKLLIDENVWNLQEIRLDLQGIPRVVVLKKKC